MHKIEKSQMFGNHFQPTNPNETIVRRRPSVPHYILFTYVLSYLTISYLFTYSAVNGFKDKSHQPIRLSLEIRKRSFAKTLSVNSSHKHYTLKLYIQFWIR